MGWETVRTEFRRKDSVQPYSHKNGEEQGWHFDWEAGMVKVIMENDFLEENIFNNTTTETIEKTTTNVVTLETIHEDLGFICTFLVIASVLIFIRIIYKLFNIFF